MGDLNIGRKIGRGLDNFGDSIRRGVNDAARGMRNAGDSIRDGFKTGWKETKDTPENTKTGFKGARSWFEDGADKATDTPDRPTPVEERKGKNIDKPDETKSIPFEGASGKPSPTIKEPLLEKTAWCCILKTGGPDATAQYAKVSNQMLLGAKYTDPEIRQEKIMKSLLMTLNPQSGELDPDTMKTVQSAVLSAPGAAMTVQQSEHEDQTDIKQWGSILRTGGAPAMEQFIGIQNNRLEDQGVGDAGSRKEMISDRLATILGAAPDKDTNALIDKLVS